MDNDIVSVSSESLSLFGDSNKPTNEIGWQFYQKSLDFKNSINLFDTVKTNENFFIGKCLPM